MNRPTLGQYVLDNFHKTEESLDPREVRSVLMPDEKYFEGLENSVHDFMMKHPDHKGDFYIACLFKWERVLFERVKRRYNVGRKSAPTPNYDMHAWKFNAKKGFCELLFVVGDRNTTIDMIRFPQFYAQHQPELLRYALMFASGALMKMVLELNGESFILSPHDVVNQPSLIIPA